MWVSNHASFREIFLIAKQIWKDQVMLGSRLLLKNLQGRGDWLHIGAAHLLRFSKHVPQTLQVFLVKAGKSVKTFVR